jgi:hypothetical protein
MDWEDGRVSCNLTPGTFCRDWIVFPLRLREDYTDPTLMASRWFLSIVAATGFIEVIPGAVVGVGLIAWSSKDDNIPAPGDTPLAVGDGELDWINRWLFPIPQGFNPDAGQIFQPMLDNVHLSKAKRRLGSDMGILLVAEAKNTTNDWTFSSDVRCLIKE